MKVLEENLTESLVKLKEAMRNGVVEFTYLKKDGSERVAKGTLNSEIMGECNPEKIESLADKKQLEYIKLTALYPSRKRLMYAYYLLYKKDETAAQKEYEALLKTAATHPVKAEGAIELKEAERVKKRFEELKQQA